MLVWAVGPDSPKRRLARDAVMKSVQAGVGWRSRATLPDACLPGTPRGAQWSSGLTERSADLQVGSRPLDHTEMCKTL